MAIKMRVLHYSKKGKMATFANAIAQKYELEINKVDAIPPAYSCDKERIVVLGLTVGDYIPDQLRLFCRELTKERAQNVALIIDGKKEGADKVISILNEAGTNVISDIMYINGGLPFIKKVSDEEHKQVKAWLDNIIGTQLA